MFVEVYRSNNGKQYLRLVESVRATNKDGKKVVKKKVILSIGALEKFDDGKPDYVKRLKESFNAGKPLIPALEPYCHPSPEVYHFTITKDNIESFGHSWVFSQVLLERILEELGLTAFVKSCQDDTPLPYDIYSYFKLLTFGTLLSSAIPHYPDAYERLIQDFNTDHVYDTLDFIYLHQDQIIQKISTSLSQKTGRSKKNLYYSILKSAKDEWKLPDDKTIMFMHECGLPVAVKSFSGYTPGHLTLFSNLENSGEEPRFILTAERSPANFSQVKDAGHGYIVSKPLFDSTKEEREWIYCDDDYIFVSDDYKYKSRIIRKTVKDKKGSTRTSAEQMVVFWSAKRQKHGEGVNRKLLDFLEELTGHPESVHITSARLQSLKKFLKKEYARERFSEIPELSKILEMIDFDKVQEYRKSLGYFQIVTSELTMDAQDVIAKYQEMPRMKDQFLEMTKDPALLTRTMEQETAYMLVCLIALLMTRIIQQRIIASGKTPDKNNVLNATRIGKALLKWKIGSLTDGLYRFMVMDDPDLKLILEAFDIKIPVKLFRAEELRQIKTDIKVFM